MEHPCKHDCPLTWGQYFFLQHLYIISLFSKARACLQAAKYVFNDGWLLDMQIIANYHQQLNTAIKLLMG
jgi:hypothetical protein